MLIVINLVIFVLLALMKLFSSYLFTGGGADILKWFILPSDLGELASRPWTLLTHMFTHTGVLHILGNMLWLWSFGYIMQDLTGNRKIFPVFIYGGLAGAIAFLLAVNLVPGLPQAPALGASAGVMAIAVSATMVAPGYRIFPMLNGGIPLWILTAIYIVIDLVLIPFNNPGGHIAHLGGALMGFIFIVLLRRGYDLSDWMNDVYDWVNNLFNPDKPKKTTSSKLDLHYKTVGSPYKKTPNVTQQRIDDILDKISQKGYSHLTDEEKDLLKRASQEDL